MSTVSVLCLRRGFDMRQVSKSHRAVKVSWICVVSNFTDLKTPGVCHEGIVVNGTKSNITSTGKCIPQVTMMVPSEWYRLNCTSTIYLISALTSQIDYKASNFVCID